MITFFTTAKPFTGHTGIIQRNALKSWKLAGPQVEVILFGDEEGAAETAGVLGLRFVPQVQRAPQGPKLLRSFFDAAQEMARNEIVCYANCDIVLTNDFYRAVTQLRPVAEKFLMVGRRWDMEIAEALNFDLPDWAERLQTMTRQSGHHLGAGWIDYFVFPKGFYLGKLPEMVIGRVHWDQWLVWKARASGAAVVDASQAVMAIHQNHDYAYHPAGKAGVWTDELSQRNYQLAGGRWHLCTIDDATHVLGPHGLQVNPLRRLRAVKRCLRTAKESLRMAALEWTRPARRAIGIGGK